MAPGATTKKIKKIKKNKEKTSVKYIALPATLPSGLNKVSITRSTSYNVVVWIVFIVGSGSTLCERERAVCWWAVIVDIHQFISE